MSVGQEGGAVNPRLFTQRPLTDLAHLAHVHITSSTITHVFQGGVVHARVYLSLGITRARVVVRATRATPPPKAWRVLDHVTSRQQ